jgi:hypothetical protein
MLVGILIDGTAIPMYAFNSRLACESAVQYIQEQSVKDAHVYCVELKIKEI